MSCKEFRRIVSDWQLPEGNSLLDRVERMIRPALLGGSFGSSHTRFVAGMQYHLGGEVDTAELAKLARISSDDHILDVCCFIGGPALQLLDTFACKVAGIDRAENCIMAANRIMQLTGFAQSSGFYVADAEKLPFKDHVFTVVWNQASLSHRESWLKEFDRVLVPRGRVALTFQFRGRNSTGGDPLSSWTIQDIVVLLRNLGYAIEHVDDLTDRDIEIGWRALDEKLSRQKREFVGLLGEAWVDNAHAAFKEEIRKMKKGIWGNARVVARKRS